MEQEEQKHKDILLSEKEIKQEMEDTLENVKHEPIEKEHFELIIPKQETQESFESFKEEYSEKILPKHEEVIESSASYTSNNPMEKPFIETQEEVLKMEHHRCSICLHICHRQNMRFVTLEEDRLVIIVGCVLRKSYTLEQARLFMAIRRAYYICCVHFTEAINKIHIFLKNPDDITSCSSELMNNLMITVNALYPQVRTQQFCDIVYNFVRRNISLKQKHPNTKGEENEKQIRYSCSVCTHVQTSNNMNNVTMKDEKLVIMIGCILRGEYSLEQAHFFVSQKYWFCICHIHFLRSVDEIHKALNIKQHDEVYSCSTELMANLMITVKKLDPWLKSSQFCHIFNKFVTRNMKLLDNTITLTGMDLEKQKPKDTISNEKEIKQETGDLSENVKEDSMEEKYFEKIVPKLEEVMEPSTSYLPPTNHLINPVQKFFMQKQITFPTLDVEPQNSKNGFGFHNLRCSVCLQICPRRDMKQVKMEEDKLVIMVGCVLHGGYTLDQAKLFMSESRRIGSCYIHYSEAINKIFDVLNIKNSLEMFSCPSESMNNLMITVNELCPWIDPSKFCRLFNEFVTRDGQFSNRMLPSMQMGFEEQQSMKCFDRVVPKLGEIVEQPTTSNMQSQDFLNNPIQSFFIDTQEALPNLDVEKQAKVMCHHRCSICLQMQTSINVKEVKIKEDKLVIMVGYVLRGDYTLKIAQLFLSRLGRMHICYIHFVEALIEIYKFLNIKNLDEISSCSSELMDKLMNTVNVLCPQTETPQYCGIIHDFVRRNISQNFLHI